MSGKIIGGGSGGASGGNLGGIMHYKSASDGYVWFLQHYSRPTPKHSAILRLLSVNSHMFYIVVLYFLKRLEHNHAPDRFAAPH